MTTLYTFVETEKHNLGEHGFYDAEEFARKREAAITHWASNGLTPEESEIAHDECTVEFDLQNPEHVAKILKNRVWRNLTSQKTTELVESYRLQHGLDADGYT